MFSKVLGLEGNCTFRSVFAIINRHLIGEYKKLSMEYYDLLKKELETKKNNKYDMDKLITLTLKMYENNSIIKLTKLKQSVIEVILIAFFPAISFLILSLSSISVNRIIWAACATFGALLISFLYIALTTWSLKWLNLFCSILSGCLSILTFIFPETNKINLISAIVIFYVIVQAFISWDDANLDWKNKVLHDVKQIE